MTNYIRFKAYNITTGKDKKDYAHDMKSSAFALDSNDVTKGIRFPSMNLAIVRNGEGKKEGYTVLKEENWRKNEGEKHSPSIPVGNGFILKGKNGRIGFKFPDMNLTFWQVVGEADSLEGEVEDVVKGFDPETGEIAA